MLTRARPARRCGCARRRTSHARSKVQGSPLRAIPTQSCSAGAGCSGQPERRCSGAGALLHRDSKSRSKADQTAEPCKFASHCVGKFAQHVPPAPHGIHNNAHGQNHHPQQRRPDAVGHIRCRRRAHTGQRHRNDACSHACALGPSGLRWRGHREPLPQPDWRARRHRRVGHNERHLSRQRLGLIRVVAGEELVSSVTGQRYRHMLPRHLGDQVRRKQ